MKYDNGEIFFSIAEQITCIQICVQLINWVDHTQQYQIKFLLDKHLQIWCVILWYLQEI